MNMREIIYSLPDQISEAIALVRNVHVSRRRLGRVLICGMGGSGISGEILAASYPEIEIIANKDYGVPKYLGRDTLGILISYSGNTEETLNNYRILSKRKIPLVAVTSGGELLEKKVDLRIKIPKGFPPRGALGYLFAPLPLILNKYRLINMNPEKELAALVKFLKEERNDLEKAGAMLAKRFINKMPVIYANSQSFGVVANRWRCQLNENAKIICHTNIIPEMNHNEIVGIGRPEGLSQGTIVVFLNDPLAYRRNKVRVQVVKEVIKDFIKSIIEIEPRGSNTLERMFWTIMLGDFISYYIAVKDGIDPMPIKRIEYLKKRLSDL